MGKMNPELLKNIGVNEDGGEVPDRGRLKNGGRNSTTDKLDDH